MFAFVGPYAPADDVPGPGLTSFLVFVWNVVVACLPRVVYSAQLVEQLVAELGGREVRVAARIADYVEETHFGDVSR
jgi:hypothetical protein